MSEELTMKDMEAEFNASMVNYREGDMVKGIIAGIENYVVYVDMGTYMQGIILPDQLSDDPAFSMMEDLKIGEEISAIVDREDDGSGNVVLSLKKANEIKAWDMLKEGMEEKTVYQVKVSQSVRGGVIAYLNGIRGFVPISRLSLKRITDEEKDAYVGRMIDVIITDADSEKRNLILSAREPEEEKARMEHDRKVSGISVGMVTRGIVESIKPYGCFVDLGEGLSGLVHISQISHRRLKTPSEEVKVGDEVDVKVIDVRDGKISLSMKALIDVMEKTETEEETETEYTSDEDASTSMAALLSGIILD